MIQVGAYPTRSDAELAQTVLTAAGIRSVVVSDDAGGAYPFDLSGAARLLVDEADAEDAAALLSDRPDSSNDDHVGHDGA
jgi:Putative prokaryotic signal transducing protein